MNTVTPINLFLDPHNVLKLFGECPQWSGEDFHCKGAETVVVMSRVNEPELAVKKRGTVGHPAEFDFVPKEKPYNISCCAFQDTMPFGMLHNLDCVEGLADFLNR